MTIRCDQQPARPRVPQSAANAYIADVSTPADFINLLKDFSILTQYTNFELLKKQEPEETTRLGIQ